MNHDVHATIVASEKKENKKSNTISNIQRLIKKLLNI